MKKLILQLACVLLLSGSGWGQLANVGATAVGNEKASDTSLLVNVSNTVEVGNICVCIFATDNIGTLFADNNDHTGVVDSTGANTWTQAREVTNAAAANGAATVSVWYTVIGTQLSSGGGTITLSTASAVTAKAVGCQEFTKGAGTLTLATGGLDEQVDGGDPGSMAISGLTSREYLFIRGIAAESDATTGLTVTSGFAEILGSQTGGGGGASNMGVRAEWDIATGTGSTSDPTLFSADNASVFIALWVDDGAGPPPCVPMRTLMGVGC